MQHNLLLLITMLVAVCGICNVCTIDYTLGLCVQSSPVKELYKLIRRLFSSPVHVVPIVLPASHGDLCHNTNDVNTSCENCE